MGKEGGRPGTRHKEAAPREEKQWPFSGPAERSYRLILGLQGLVNLSVCCTEGTIRRLGVCEQPFQSSDYLNVETSQSSFALQGHHGLAFMEHKLKNFLRIGMSRRSTKPEQHAHFLGGRLWPCLALSSSL